MAKINFENGTYLKLVPKCTYKKYKAGEEIPAGKKVGDKYDPLQITGVMFSGDLFINGKMYFVSGFEGKEPSLIVGEGKSAEKFADINITLYEKS